MSEESPENFNSGDVVWVKLGSSWWPGEVKDAEELPNDILDFKKPPLVIVKFFDEDSYEYIKSWANIYPYNCEKKNEFIKKGMAAFRAKVPHMDKFPKDVLTAESNVGGNPNILSDPMFLPDKKKNYAAEIFGTPSPKVKVNKDKRRSNTKSSQKNTAHITHRRFLGVDDYRAFICIQYPGKDRVPGDKEDEEVLRINQEPEQEFNCHTCSFTTKRLEVMILHTKSHIQGVYVSSARKNKQSVVRKKTKKSRSMDDVIESESSSSDSEPIRERKRKPKSQTTKEPKVKKTQEKDAPTQSIDIRNELLAVWDDSNDDDDEFDISLDKLGKSQKLSQSTLEGVLSGTIVDSADESLNQSLDDTLNKSEALGAMVEETLEQIRAEVTNPSEPEVINKPEAPSQSVEDALTQSVEETLDKSTEELLNQSEMLNQMNQKAVNQSTEESLSQLMPPDQSVEKAPQESSDEVAVQLVDDKLSDDNLEKEIVNDQSNPESVTDSKEAEKVEKKMDRDIQEEIKSCFDFDEDDEEDNAIVNKAAVGGRKIPRVIPLAERRKSKDIIEGDLNRGKILKGSESFNRKEAGEGHSEEVDAAFKELMEMTTVPELPEVQNTLKCEQNFHNIKTIKFPDKPEPVGSPPKVTKTEKKDSSEVATKLTNPKKRFVKSFEDFELMQNEIRRKEEQDELAKNEETESRTDYSVEDKPHVASSSVVYSSFDDYENSSGSPLDPVIELSKLKSKIMFKIIEEANITGESKSKIMSKIHEPKVEAVGSKHLDYKATKSEKYSAMSHRTPRSKILESYMKDTNNQKAEEHKKGKAEPPQSETNQPRIDATSNNMEEIVDDRKKEAVIRKDVVPPKKNKWSRRGSHPKKDRNLFLLEDLRLDRLDDPPVKEVQKDDKPEESVKLDTQEVVATSDAFNKELTIGNDSVVKEFAPFSTNNEVILAKEALVEELNEETHVEEASSRLPLVEKETEEIVARQEEDSEIVLSEHKETEKVSQIDEETVKVSEETEKLHLIDDKVEEDTVCSKDETEKWPVEDGKIDRLSLKDEETERFPTTIEEMDVVTSKPEEIKKSSFEDEEIEKLLSKYGVTDNVSSKDEEIEKSSLKDEETEKLLSKGEETEVEVSSRDEETEMVPEVEKTEMVPEVEETEMVPEVEETEMVPEVEETEMVPEVEETVMVPEIEETVVVPEVEETVVVPEVDETVMVPEIEETVVVPEVEETGKMSSKDEETVELSPKEEEPEKILEKEVSDKLSTEDEETDKLESNQEPEETITNEEESNLLLKEVDHLSVGENEVDTLPTEEKEPQNLLENEDKAETIMKEECNMAAVEETVKLDVSNDNLDKIESVPRENGTPPLNNIILDQDNCAVPSYQPTTPTEGDKLNSDVVLEDEKLIAPEEIPSISPNRDVFTPTDTSLISPKKSSCSPKKSLCSPPKKSKKRKMSESISSNATKTDSVDLGVENFSPSEKRMKETDFKDKDTTPPLEKRDLSDLESTDSVQEGYKPEVVDNGTEVNEPDIKINAAPVGDEEIVTTEPVAEPIDLINKVEIQCASSSVESFKFSIQTNLSNLTSREEMSALALATLSEIKADLENSNSSMSEMREEQPEMGEERTEVIEEQPKVKDQTELGEEQTEVREEQPEVREEQLEVSEQQPEVREEQLEVREEQLEAREEQPEVTKEQLDVREVRKEQPEIREEHPEIRIEQPEIREEHPEIREEHSEIREDHPEIREEHPEIREEHPEIREERLEIREEHPEISEEHPEIRTEQPEIRVEQPEIRAEQPEIRAEQPEIRVEQPEIRAEQQEIRVEKPEIRVEKPEIRGEQPEIREEHPVIREEQPEINVEPERSIVLPIPVQSELVPIEGNLTVVSEKDLADGQVEITTEKVISPKKPVTLSNFSMDFSDSGSDSNSNSTNDTIGDIGKSTDFTSKGMEFASKGREFTSKGTKFSSKGTEFTSKGTEFTSRGTEFTSKGTEFTSKGTEFTSKAMTKQIKRLNKKKENAYERLELLKILEGNSDSEKKPREYQQPPKKTVMEDICDFEEHIPSQIVCAKGLKRGMIDIEGDFVAKEKSQKMSEKSTASKLLERLTESKTKATPSKTSIHSEINISEGIGKFPTKIQTMPSSTKTKYIVKSKTPASINKPIILSEQIIKPASETKSKPKRMLNDIEDVEAFVIHKDPKKNKPDEEFETVKAKSGGKAAGKAKILQQTIITPAGEIIQPSVNQAQTDDNIFDINSMPIVLSDEILTPESIENMPIVIGTETKSVDHEKPIRRPTQNRIITKTTVPTTQPILNKTHTVTKHSKPPRILQTVGSKIIKNSPLLPNTAKPGKYIIVPQSGMPQNKYLNKKAPIVKRSPVSVPTGILTKVPNIAPEPSGNKIMIVTNQQGQQQRLLLTPAQQKMLGYQNQKVTKTVMKGNMLQKSVLAKSVPLVEAGTSGVISKSPSIIGQKIVMATNSSPGLITTTSHQVISNQGRTIKNVAKRVPSTSQKVFSNTTKQKTILIKNQHGQTVRKIQGTDDELLDKQVAEQLEAIKASSGMKFSSQPKQTETYKITPKSSVRRSYSKKIEVKPKLGPPPLAGIPQSPKPDKLATMSFSASKKADSIEVKTAQPLVPEETKPDRPLNQLVIQDAVGNQTTITEGQILALPSETVDGQPQSYMLVTLDESGNLTPLNSEALMSLDPNLGLGGDLSNMVLQIDQGALTERPQTIPIKTIGGSELAKTVMVESTIAAPVPEASVTTEISESPVVEQKIDPVIEMPQAIVPSTNGDPGQQLIVTGDPIATQKFLESLTEGTTDLANILANADGNSILIQADGQQILINTNSDNQMLLSMNNDSIGVSESTEGGGNPIFATQPNKNQDILAAALADTDVFQQEQHSTQGKITSQLSPSNTLYPMNVGNVLETSLTLSSPIMTPLEVPSTNSKKIPDDEADILTQVPKNVDLPITITDPNISQTVANQQVASLMASELQTNLELTLPISETTISAVSTEMNSPSFVYSLPTLDDSVDMTQKPFNSSMPLLNEDVEDNSTSKIKTDEESKLSNESSHKGDSSSDKPQGVGNSEGCFLEEEEGRFTLGGEMCSSLSEPPPEMFDLPEVNPNFVEKRDTNIPSLQSTSDVSDNASKEDDTTDLSTQADTSSEGSCEIPLQPQIVTKSLDLSQNLDSLKRSIEESKEGSKKCKFD